MNAVQANGQQLPGTYPSREVLQGYLQRWQHLRSQGATEQTSPEMKHLSQLLSKFKVCC